MSDSNISLSAQILIAMPALNDPNFNKTVTLICQHSSEDGAMGIVLNQPTSITATELLSQLEMQSESKVLREQAIYAGGPMQTDRGFILHNGSSEWESSMQITPDLHLTSSHDILQAIADEDGPADTLIVLGYAGWAPGQLETEIGTNSWLTIEYQSELVFATPADKQWITAGNMLGVDLNLLASHAGHA